MGKFAIRGPYGDPLRTEREDLLSAAEGFITQEPDAAQVVLSAGSALTSGNLYGQMVALRAGEIVTSLTYQAMTANAAVVTLIKAALLDVNGNRLAVSSDQQALFTAGALPRLVPVPMVTPYVVPADGAYFTAILFTGTTGPTLLRGNATFDTMALTGKRARNFRLGSQTDIQTTNAMRAGDLLAGAGGPGHWVGVS